MPDLSDGVNWSETDANNNQASPNGWPEGMMPSGVNDAARADRGALKRFWNKVNPVQPITPSGNLWTFQTANPAYPTAYVNGEIYNFTPSAPGVGGDQFQVNALGPKPIWKRIAAGPTGLVPLIAHDFRSHEVSLVYDAALNAGTGVFMLLNPLVPITGDGSGTGASVAGVLSATGYKSRSGINGPYQTNNVNIQWTGTQAHLWIDTTDLGPIVTGSAGNIVIGGDISAGNITASGNITAGGNLTLNGNLFGSNWDINNTGISTTNGAFSGTLTANTITASADLSSNGRLDIAGAGQINGTLTAQSGINGNGYVLNNTGVSTSNATFSGLLQANGGATLNQPVTINGQSGGAIVNNGLIVYPASTGANSLWCRNGGAQIDYVTWVGASGSGGLTVGYPEPANITGSVNLTAGGNYYRNGAVIPVLADALNDGLRDAPEGAAMVIVKRAGELEVQTVELDQLAARVAALEAALTTRTE